MPLLIIGSGRAALTLVSHLPEHMLNRAVVVDPSGNWLETWALRCLRQGVTYLRTPVTQVPFQSCTGLQDFIAKRGNREVDAVQSSARYVPLPSCRAFAEYCNAQVELSQRFRRVRMIEDTVVDLEHIIGGSGSSAIRVTLSSGQSMEAAQVVHAARWSTPVVPSWMVEAKLFSHGAVGGPPGHGTPKAHEQHDEDGGILGVEQRRGGRGIGDINNDTLATLADVDVRTADVKGRSVVVVGGGMGACTLATAALRQGANRVTLLCRGIIRRREQECDVAYFGNKGLAKFRAVQEPTKRLEILREAKGGFSTINSQMWMQVQDALKKDGGKSGSGEEEDPTEPTFQIIERREIERVEWCDSAKRWRVIMLPFSSTETGDETSRTHLCTSTSMDDDTNPVNHGCNTKVADEKPSSSASSLLELTADFVWAACGEIVDASQDPVLQHLLHKGGRIVGGYPVLVEDKTPWISDLSSSSACEPQRGSGVTTAAANSLGSMRWPGLPLFFVGAYTSLSVGPGASLPAGHRLAARAVASAMHAHAKECRKCRGNESYAAGLTAAQLVTKVAKEDEGGFPRVLRLVPISERHRALMDVRELKARTDLPRVELSRYEVVDEDFLIHVRLTLPEAVPTERVRVAFTENSVEVWAAGDKAAYRFFAAKLYKPIIVDRCTFKVSTKKKRIIVVLHKFDNLSWRFLKG